MSISQGLAVIFAVLTLIGVYRAHSYSKTIQELKTELVITQGDLQLVQAQLDAERQARSGRQRAEKEINDVAAKRNQFIDSLPTSWGNTPLPDECVRMWTYSPSTSTGSDFSTGGSDATD